MPIIVRHEPDPRLLAEIGYTVGQGMQNQWAQEMAQRERLQARALQANQLSQRLAQMEAAERQRNQIGAQFQRDMLGMEWDRQAAQEKAALDRELSGLREKERMERLEFEWQQRRENQRLAGLDGMQRDIAKGFWDKVNEMQGMLDQKMQMGWQLSPEEQQELERLNAEIRKLEQSPEKMASAQAAFELWSKFSPNFAGMMPKAQDQLEQSRAETDVNGKKISFVQQPDGRWDQVEVPKEDKPKPTIEPPKTVDEVMYRDDMKHIVAAAVAATKGIDGTSKPEAVRAWIRAALGLPEEKQSGPQAPPKDAQSVKVNIPD